jgi:hypothetical protein
MLSRFSFPLFGRCPGLFSLGNSEAREQARHGITHAATIDPDNAYRDLLRLPPGAPVPPGGPYPRSLHVANLADGYVTHQGGYITRDSLLIEEMSQHYDYPIAEHRYLHSLRLFRKIEKVDRTVVALAGAGQFNYCHWWLDIVPKLHLIRTYGDVPGDPLYYVEAHKPFQREILGFLGLEPASILNSREHHIIRAEKMVASSPRTPLQWPDPWAVAWLRETFSKFAEPYSGRPSCVLISRKGAKTRKIVNEDEIAECLAPLKPVTVDLQELSVAQQIGLFADAKWIVAPHGAGLTNMIFAPGDCRIVELFGSAKINDCYRFLAEVVGCAHTFVLGEDFVDPADGQTQIRADVEGVRRGVFFDAAS